MNYVVLYAELIRSLMRAVQHLTLRDVDGIDGALNALTGWRLDDDEVVETVEALYGRIDAAETSEEILDAIDGLSALAEKLIQTQLTRLKVEHRPFQLSDWPMGLSDDLDPDGALFHPDEDDHEPLHFGEDPADEEAGPRF